jgi:hypothetical protein
MNDKTRTPSPGEAATQSRDSQDPAIHGTETQQPQPSAKGRQSGSASKASQGKQWTPELQMQLIKEIVTAALAFLIVIYTLIIVWHSFTFVGDTQKVGDAKDLLTVMLGLAGVVVGYYFGRVSADARASQANAKAGEVLSQNANLKAKAQGISANLDHIIDDSPPAMTGDSEAAANHLAQLCSLRDELRDLTAPSMN